LLLWASSSLAFLMDTLKFKLKKVEELISNDRNSKTHTAAQINRIAASIQEFGFLNPILINKENLVISGNGRLQAAKKLNLEKVPTLEASHLTDTQRRAFVIADNRLAETGSGWNDEILRLELSELSALNFNIELTGFEEFDKDFSKAMAAADEFLNDDLKKDDPKTPGAKCPYCGRPF